MPDRMEELTPAQVAQLLAGHEVLLIDVREPDEFAREHIHGALLHPLSTFDPAALPDHPAIVFQCRSGMRSARAMMASGRAGIAVAGHLAGGIEAWKQAGLPTISSDTGTRR